MCRKKIEHGGKLTLVSAPAGYGKTTLITEWLKIVNNRESARVSMDARDNDPKRFFTYLIASLKTQEGFGQEVSNLIESPQLPSPEIIATLLLNQLVSTGSPSILVLDDYLHQTVEFLIENSPPSFHIVIISRLDPPLSLGKWRVLCSTAILNRLCADLCNELTDRKDSKNILLNLEQKNLFLIPLDEERQWYRYHHLFADFLRTEMEEKQEAVLHQKASKWYEGNDYKTEAIEHSLAAGDVEKAVGLIKGQIGQSIIRGDLYTLVG